MGPSSSLWAQSCKCQPYQNKIHPRNADDASAPENRWDEFITNGLKLWVDGFIWHECIYSLRLDLRPACVRVKIFILFFDLIFSFMANELKCEISQRSGWNRKWFWEQMNEGSGASVVQYVGKSFTNPRVAGSPPGSPLIQWAACPQSISPRGSIKYHLFSYTLK